MFNEYVEKKIIYDTIEFNKSLYFNGQKKSSDHLLNR